MPLQMLQASKRPTASGTDMRSRLIGLGWWETGVAALDSVQRFYLWTSLRPRISFRWRVLALFPRNLHSSAAARTVVVAVPNPIPRAGSVTRLIAVARSLVGDFESH